jgi:hypothetical protein
VEIINSTTINKTVLNEFGSPPKLLILLVTKVWKREIKNPEINELPPEKWNEIKIFIPLFLCKIEKAIYRPNNYFYL